MRKITTGNIRSTNSSITNVPMFDLDKYYNEMVRETHKAFKKEYKEIMRKRFFDSIFEPDEYFNNKKEKSMKNKEKA